MVPSPPEYSGKLSVKLPFTVVDDEYFFISDIVPALPANFTFRVDVNGNTGKEVTVVNDAFDEGHACDFENIQFAASKETNVNEISFACYGNTVISVLDVYVDGVKMNLTQ